MTTQISAIAEATPALPNRPAVFLGLALLCAATASLFWVRVLDPDVLMHLRTGQWIVQHRAIPRTDIFSANALGRPWTTHEWLWEVLAYLCYQAAQWKALFALRLVLVAGTLAFAIATAKLTGARTAATLSASLLIIGPLASFAEIRPQLASEFLFATTMFLLTILSRRTTPTAPPSRSHLLIPNLTPAVLVVLWANLHGAVLLGFVVLGCGVVAAALARQRTQFIALLITTVVCAIAAMINPHGWELLTFPFKVVGQQSFRMQIYEWSRPDFTRPFWPFWLLVLLSVPAALTTWRRIPMVNLLLFAVFLVAAIASRRQIPFFALVAIVPCAVAIDIILQRPTAAAPSWLPNLTAVLLCALAVPFAHHSYLPAGRELGLGLAHNRFPEIAANRLAHLHSQGTVMNDYNDGGFLIWRLFPEWPVTMDGRVDVYGPELVKKYEQVWAGAPGWQEILRQWRVEAIVGRFEISRAMPQHNLYHELASSSDWALVYWDDGSQLFLHRGTTLDGSGLKPYRLVAPGLSMQQNTARAKSKLDWEALGADLRRSVSEAPESRRAAAMLKAWSDSAPR